MNTVSGLPTVQLRGAIRPDPGGSHHCARAYAIIRQPSATESIFPSITVKNAYPYQHRPRSSAQVGRAIDHGIQIVRAIRAKDRALEAAVPYDALNLSDY